ncbi:hypothetical protein TUBRATIS_13520 [Tubulinosema ratisbonensis]|uniref:Uncharacterized protein n=1 Tax=Tubulinosema ratisbonensis TaxID=291195 RepID=A0A437ALZ4_9MICR|nr:hypothetical protein TUBRATIS_13520 [Tubulinosema ratisbonensis]
MNFVKIFLIVLGLFCVFLTISGYNLRNNSTNNEEILIDSPILSEKQEILVNEKNNNTQLLTKENTPLIDNENPHNISIIKEEKIIENEKLSKEQKKLTNEELDQIFNNINDEERKDVTNNQLFLGRVFFFTGKMLKPIQNFRLIKLKLETNNTDLSKEILNKATEIKNEYFNSVNNFLDVLFKVKRSQINLSKLYLEKKSMKFILSGKMKNKKKMKKKFKKKIEEFYQTYKIFTKNISSLFKESILLNDKMFYLYNEVLSNINVFEIEPLIYDLILKGVNSQNSLTVILKNVNFKLNDGFVIFKNYYELCKERYKENELSEELFNLCENDYNSIFDLIENVNSEWKETILKNNETLSDEISFLKEKGINDN